MQRFFTKPALGAIVPAGLALLSAMPAGAETFKDGFLWLEPDAATQGAKILGYDEEMARDLYMGGQTDLIIPDYVTDGTDTYPVTVVGQEAFRFGGWDNIVLGANVKVIEKWGFVYNNASTVTLNSALESIGELAFNFNQNLQTITFNEGLRSIGQYAFQDSGLLGEITIPASVTELGDAPFRSRPVSAVNVAPGNTVYKSVDGVVFTIDGTELVTYPSGHPGFEYEVPAGVTKLRNMSMRNMTVTQSVILPAGLRSIGRQAFASNGLMDLEIPATVEEIGDGFIYNNRSLYNLSVAPGSPWFKMQDGMLVGIQSGKVMANDHSVQGQLNLPDGITEVAGYAFWGEPGITGVTLPQSCKRIGVAGFYENFSLASLQMPGVEYIDSMAFQNCQMLPKVSFSPNLKELGLQAFWMCQSLGGDIVLPEGMQKIGIAAFNMTGISSISFPSTITEYGNSICFQCQNLRSASLPDDLEEVPIFLFSWCSNLSDVNIPSKAKAILDGAYYSTALSHFDFPETLRYIGNSSFYGTPATDVVVPDGVTECDDFAFAWMQNLRSIKFGAGVKRIGGSCCGSTPSLVNVELPEGLLSIGECAFLNASALPTLTIPSTVNSIGDVAFQWCPFETLVNNAAVPQPLVEGTQVFFEDIYPTCVLTVPAESVDEYRNAPVWCNFLNIGSTSGAEGADIETAAPYAVAITGTDGIRRNSVAPGLNIITMSDGSVRKVMVK